MKTLCEYLNESLNEALGYDAAEKALIKDLKERAKKEEADVKDDDILDLANKLMEYYKDDLDGHEDIKEFMDKIASDIKDNADDWVDKELGDYADLLKKIYK